MSRALELWVKLALVGAVLLGSILLALSDHERRHRDSAEPREACP